MKLIAVFAAMLALAGCQTTQEQIALDGEFCESISARRGTDAFVSCMLMREQNRIDGRRRAGAALSALGESMSNPPRRQMNCTTTRFGRSLNTTCW
jgi:hypothetical protein